MSLPRYWQLVIHITITLLVVALCVGILYSLDPVRLHHTYANATLFFPATNRPIEWRDR